MSYYGSVLVLQFDCRQEKERLSMSLFSTVLVLVDVIHRCCCMSLFFCEFVTCSDKMYGSIVV